MSEAVSINTNKIQQWIVNKSDVENIRNEMMALGHDEFSIEAHIKEYKKIIQSKKQERDLCLQV